MKHSHFSLTLSPYIALLIVTLVGSGATLALLRFIEITSEYALYTGL
ncbi:MAG: hypothetical protein WBK28_03230 [Minisyncoccia bacterium]